MKRHQLGPDPIRRPAQQITCHHCYTRFTVPYSTAWPNPEHEEPAKHCRCTHCGSRHLITNIGRRHIELDPERAPR